MFKLINKNNSSVFLYGDIIFSIPDDKYYLVYEVGYVDSKSSYDIDMWSTNILYVDDENTLIFGNFRTTVPYKVFVDDFDIDLQPYIHSLINKDFTNIDIVMLYESVKGILGPNYD